MSNMIYCRFQNTLRDLQDCLEALDELGGDIILLSDEEMKSAEELIAVCGEIHYQYNEWKK